MTMIDTIRHAPPALQPALRPAPALGRLLARAGRATASAVRRLQYGQMVAALNHLSDENLAEIGLRRRDIPARARSLIYPD